MSLRYEEIAEILKIIDSSSCEELIVETNDVKLVVRRAGATGPNSAPGEARGPAVATPATPQPAVRETRAAAPQLKSAVDQAEVMAPMVGTFYRAPSPDAPPFVEEGSAVRKGDPLCLIEVMKLFTTINSEVSGRIVQIGAENGELVEYGRTLFVIDPD